MDAKERVVSPLQVAGCHNGMECIKRHASVLRIGEAPCSILICVILPSVSTINDRYLTFEMLL